MKVPGYIYIVGFIFLVFMGGETITDISYRWLDIADQEYSASYRSSYSYDPAQVSINYSPIGRTFAGTLSATNLKPNFAYQVKLVATSGTDANERIGLAGRWWQEEWNGTAWVNGHNLNDKGDGSSPNPNDEVYYANKDIPHPTSPTGLKYKYSGYLVFDYFITDKDGNAELNFEADSSYHVLWKTTQSTWTSSDGPIKSSTFDADDSSAYYDTGGDDFPVHIVRIFGEWERLPIGGVFLAPGDYQAQFILTEESFHGSGGTYAGNWAQAISIDVSLLVVSTAHSTPGSLDTSFDTDGKVITAFGSGYDYGQAVAIQADGKIVVAGYTDYGTDDDFALARYNSDGSLDSSFDTDGKVTTDFNSDNDYGYAVAIQTDGKIVVAGGSDNGSDYDFALARYNSDGSLDTSFDGDASMPGFPGNGKITTDVGSSSGYGSAIAIQSDGKIVVAGESYNGSDDDFALARYNSDGTLDTSFDTDGMVTTDFGSYDAGCAVAIQTDGKIVVAGTSNNGSDDDFALARYNTDGSLDTSFDTDGKVTTDFNSDNDYGYAVAIQTDGKIVVAGGSDNGSDYDFALARYNSDGNLDNSFDTDGKVTTDFNSDNDCGYAVAIQTDGKIVVAGESDNSSGYDFGLARYNVSETGIESVSNGSTSNTLPGIAITNNSGSTCEFTVEKYPVLPGGAPADEGEMPVQWDITSTCSTLNVDLVFSYTDAELANGNNVMEANLVTFKHTGGGSWSNQGGTVDTGANTVTLTGVTSLSDWTIGDSSSSPTAITLQGFTAHTGWDIYLILAVGLLGLLVAGMALFRRGHREDRRN
jgi:uncharacterized delta-60 repeat protein